MGGRGVADDTELPGTNQININDSWEFLSCVVMMCPDWLNSPVASSNCVRTDYIRISSQDFAYSLCCGVVNKANDRSNTKH